LSIVPWSLSLTAIMVAPERASPFSLDKSSPCRAGSAARAKIALASPQVLYLHCLPADRGREVTDAVMDGPHSVVWDEAENRMHTAKALMALTMGGYGSRL